MAKEFTNRLVHQKSPYLLQHAHNPVDWHPWGQEAFDLAKNLDKPIFLSIGYSTCHWCHIMEKESFANKSIAKMLNDTFINIKVDREELPEIDNLYMEFAQSMMSGAAGWPLNVILTPSLKPFFATTYLPPESERGMLGLKELINRIRQVWNSPEKERVTMQADKVVEVFAESMHVSGDTLPGRELVSNAMDMLYKMADPVFGGMKGVPKFPLGYQLNFFIRYSYVHQDARALYLVDKTLDMMHRGGIWDHLGGGFSRYSIDEEWQIPHFEKMLYDNALLLHSYTEAWQATKEPLYRKVAEELADFILAEMTHSNGGFYSAQDADSDGEEGSFYTWSQSEVKEVLGAKLGLEFCKFFGVSPKGNFEGRSILHTRKSIEEFAEERNLDLQELKTRLNEEKERLLKFRKERTPPQKDDKILSSWNGLMIYSLCLAGCAFNNETYLNAALKSAKFIASHMIYDGRLLRRWRDGEAKFYGGLEEYAFYIRGILSLFEAGLGTEWLTLAMELSEVLSSEFKEYRGAFYQTDGKDPNLILRRCQFSDGAEPSGNAIHCENLLRLYEMTAINHYLEEAEDILKAVKQMLETYPPGYCYHLMNLLRYWDKKGSLAVIALNEAMDHKDLLFEKIFTSFVPHRSIIWRQEGDEEIFHRIPYISRQEPKEGKTTLYFCRIGVCEQPIQELSAMLEALEK